MEQILPPVVSVTTVFVLTQSFVDMCLLVNRQRRGWPSWKNTEKGCRLVILSGEAVGDRSFQATVLSHAFPAPCPPLGQPSRAYVWCARSLARLPDMFHGQNISGMAPEIPVRAGFFRRIFDTRWSEVRENWRRSKVWM